MAALLPLLFFQLSARVVSKAARAPSKAALPSCFSFRSLCTLLQKISRKYRVTLNRWYADERILFDHVDDVARALRLLPTECALHKFDLNATNKTRAFWHHHFRTSNHYFGTSISTHNRCREWVCILVYVRYFVNQRICLQFRFRFTKRDRRMRTMPLRPRQE